MNITNRIFRGKTFKCIVFHRFKRNCVSTSENVTHVPCKEKPEKVKRKYTTRMPFMNAQKMKTDSKGESPDMFQYYKICSGCSSGTHYYLPMGMRALEKLTRLIDEEMQELGAYKISMPTLGPRHMWKKTGRWETPELFKLEDRLGKKFCLCPTHEELVTSLAAEDQVPAYCLPLMLYQITRKFRDEMHPKFAFLRGREFEMKDLYTFDKSEEAAKETYDRVCDSYHNIFERLGLKYTKVEGDTGNIGGNLSHEFHLTAQLGEDTICTCEQCGLSTNLELIAPEKQEATNFGCTKPNCSVAQTSAIEVGHAFYLGTKYSKTFNACTEVEGQGKTLLQMGCYGIGVSRLMQASVEVLRKGLDIVWPSVIAPYQVMVIPQKGGYLGDEFLQLSDELYDKLTSLHNLRTEVIIDDNREKTVGRRLQTSSQLGFPYAIIVNRKTVQEQLYEVVNLVTKVSEELSLDQVMNKFSLIKTL